MGSKNYNDVPTRMVYYGRPILEFNVPLDTV